MPTYSYTCETCDLEFTKTRGMNDPEDPKCPTCGADAKRNYTIARIKFKGEGFYSTDKAE